MKSVTLPVTVKLSALFLFFYQSVLVEALLGDLWSVCITGSVVKTLNAPMEVILAVVRDGPRDVSLTVNNFDSHHQ